MNIDNQLLDTLKSIDRTLKRIALAMECDQQKRDCTVLMDWNGVRFIPRSRTEDPGMTFTEEEHVIE